jgi:IS5 family transposase
MGLIAISGLEELAGLKMYVFQSAGQLSIELFHIPFGGKLDPGHRWVVLSDVTPWQPLENSYAPQFNATTGAPAKSFRAGASRSQR